MPNDGTDQSVDRNAIGGQLPCEVERIQSWLRSNIEVMTGEFSDWPEEERAQMRPGCKVLLEIIDGEADEALAGLQRTSVRRDNGSVAVAGTPAQLLSSPLPRGT